MIYILCMIAGAVIFMGGFFVGVKAARVPLTVEEKEKLREEPKPSAPATLEVSEEEKALAGMRKQYANWMLYDGRQQE